MSTEQGFVRQAIYCLNKVVHADKEDVHALWDRAVLYTELGHHKRVTHLPPHQLHFAIRHCHPTLRHHTECMIVPYSCRCAVNSALAVSRHHVWIRQSIHLLQQEYKVLLERMEYVVKILKRFRSVN